MVQEDNNMSEDLKSAIQEPVLEMILNRVMESTTKTEDLSFELIGKINKIGPVPRNHDGKVMNAEQDDVVVDTTFLNRLNDYLSKLESSNSRLEDAFNHLNDLVG